MSQRATVAAHVSAPQMGMALLVLLFATQQQTMQFKL